MRLIFCFLLCGVGLVASTPARAEKRVAERRIDTLAGTGDKALGAGSGPALSINIGEPFGVEIGPQGALYICEVTNHRVLRLDLAKGEITTVAGTGERGYAGDGGPATRAKLNEPYEVRFDKAGHMFFVEMQNHVVRRVDAATGLISTVAGNGTPGFSGDEGPATKAQLRQPHSIALDGAGQIYIADILNHRIRRVDAAGIMHTYAGTEEKRLPKAGAKVTGSPVLGPRALFLEGNNLWVALREGHSVWRIELGRDTWQHIAGSGQRGFAGDNGPGPAAMFDGPKGLAVDAAGDIYVVDTENQAIRRIDGKTFHVSTVAGAGPKALGFGGDGGPATAAKLARPHGIGIGPHGELYIGDSNNHRVRVVHPAE